MPKYLVTNGSYFQPFSYDELVRPVEHLQEVHNAAQDAYDTLSMETSALEQYISRNEDDKRARALYDDYKTKLETLQNNLWANGVTSQTRRDLSAAKAGYASNIARLQKAIQARQERSQEYWNARHQNPDLVAGADPGLSGLDNYLDNDLYGQNWWSYDSAQFERDMATETKARAQEMLRGLTDPNGVVRNPRLAGILTRVLSSGFTNAELSDASDVVDVVINMTPEQRAQFYTDNQVDPVSQLLSESLINRYDATGVRGQDVSDVDKLRLLNRGKAGWTSGILGKDIKDFTDPYFEQQMRINEMNYKYGLEHPELFSENVNDTDTDRIEGANASQMKRMLDRKFGEDTLLRSKVDGSEVRGSAGASELVFSGDKRRKAYEMFGFDIGRDPKKLLSGNFLSGVINRDGTDYEIRYNPSANGGNGAIQYRVAGSGSRFINHDEYTQRYNAYRTEYLDALDYYKKNDPDVYKLATIDPDEQYNMYKDESIDFASTPLTGYRDAVLSKPKYQNTTTLRRTWVARAGEDDGKYLPRISELIGSALSIDAKGNIAKEKEWRAYNGQPGHIHEMDKWGNLGQKSITRPSELFKVKDGKITNLSKIMLDPNAVANGYLIVGLADKGDRLYSVGIDMLNSDSIKYAFMEARGIMQDTEDLYRAGELSKEERGDWIQYAVNKVTNSLKGLTGYDNNTYSPSGTSSENPYYGVKPKK